MAGAGPLSVARAMWLIEWLPEGSALSASVRGGHEHRPWPLPTVLAAGVVNALNNANWQRSGGRGSRPTAITSPPVRTAKVAGRKATSRPTTESARVARRAAVRAARADRPQAPPLAPDDPT